MNSHDSPPVLTKLSTSTRIGRTYSVALTGMRGRIISLEADIGNALPGFTLLGLPDQSLQEAKDRIRAAARNSGLEITRRHLTVNLTPASLHKRGSIFDLAIIMAAWGADYTVHHETGPIFLAALGLDGTLQGAPGILPAVMAAVEAGYPEVIVAQSARFQAEMVPGAKVRSYQHLTEVAHDFGAAVAPRAAMTQRTEHKSVLSPKSPQLDFENIRGQQEAKWALEIAAAGGHHLLFQGPPGAGKTMLAQSLPSIMPRLDPTMALENAAIQSLLDGQDSVDWLHPFPPFQAPHHTTTAAALLGGGSGVIRPGAVSQAHGGVLFLDEATEFKSAVLDSLRQPLETGTVIIHRARQTVEFPARFQLVMAANPCACGHNYGTARKCRCSSLQRRRYAAKLSGPLLDRVDLQVWVEALTSQQLNAQTTEASETVAARVTAAVQQAQERLAAFGLSRNAEIPAQLLQDPKLQLDAAGQRILDRALDAEHITARGYGRTIRVAWTIADLLQAERPTADHVDMALYLRLRAAEHHES